ncbi:hypothetical protein BCV72DRAFT_250816 [Rhizopus microsporus var. microsporus]|uniref:Uncharacterized protein n=1 Tax=Rhizopus microsporus var. microsporus TaxID=86635 RepID=A0A1X0QZD2_RHIZD|nr:hypothetical protein BCV72DRAFT_250816 [Rhizopus microsporus var. microsporus]
MASPLRSNSTEHNTTENGSPLRYKSRYSERFKSLVTDSPPRDPIRTPERTTAISYGSPLRKTSEKYSSIEIKNEDRGQWREAVVKQEEEVKEVAIKESIQQRNKDQTEEKIEKKRKDSHSNNTLPHYMQGTYAYENRFNSRKEERKQKDILKPRPGGITKRVGMSKIPKYKSTTSINAIEEIKNEMSPDDVYVPMAARIKMFEKGLGNGSNKAPVTTTSTKNSRSNESPPKTTPSNHTTSTTTTTATTNTPTVVARSKSTQSSTNTSVPNYARETIATLRRSNSHHKDQSSQESQSKPKKEQRHIEVKPFRFATDARSQHRQAAFNEKLKIWKQKENEQKKQQLENEQELTNNKRR